MTSLPILLHSPSTGGPHEGIEVYKQLCVIDEMSFAISKEM